MVGLNPVKPPDHDTVYGPVPPDGVTVMVPVEPPKHSTLVCDVVAVSADAGWVMVEVIVAEHPFASVTVTK